MLHREGEAAAKDPSHCKPCSSQRRSGIGVGFLFPDTILQRQFQVLLSKNFKLNICVKEGLLSLRYPQLFFALP